MTATDTLTDLAWELDAAGFEQPYIDVDEWRG